jgi:hypothetical protein
VTVEEKIIRKVSYCEKITVVDFDQAKKDLAMGETFPSKC